MISFSCTNENYRNDLMELVRAFEQRTDEELSLAADYALFPGEMRVEVTADKFGNFRKFFRFPYAPADAMEAKRLEKRYLKIALYGVLVFLTGRELPYGCLTGIRPTKLYAELGEGAHDVFLQDFSVRPEKLALIERIVREQEGLRNPDPERVADLFVFIPFCPTRCAYCSFVSMPVDRQRKLLRPYTDDLTDEIGWLKKRAKKLGYSIRAVYVGGGTPTALPLDMLDEVLAACRVRGAKEFTVEAGRPDTITEEALALLKSRGVTRVSVNPQTFNDETLKRIGRRHTAADMRSPATASMSIWTSSPCFPARARRISSARWTARRSFLPPTSPCIRSISKRARNCARAATRARRTRRRRGNLENVGYTKPGKACLYNMDVMEEDTTVFAAGAAAISKKVTPAINLIERNANYKEPLEYVKHFDTVMQKQKDFWK